MAGGGCCQQWVLLAGSVDSGVVGGIDGGGVDGGGVESGWY